MGIIFSSVSHCICFVKDCTVNFSYLVFIISFFSHTHPRPNLLRSFMNLVDTPWWAPLPVFPEDVPKADVGKKSQSLELKWSLEVDWTEGVFWFFTTAVLTHTFQCFYFLKVCENTRILNDFLGIAMLHHEVCDLQHTAYNLR